MRTRLITSAAPTVCSKFREDPASFLNKTRQSMAVKPVGIQRQKNTVKPPPKENTYTCPMHPEVRSDKPGSCPKCGMALEPVTIALPKQRVEYTCPMHPEIVRDAPGNCPICGMALEPRTVSLDEEENHELVDMRRRFWVSVVLTIPVFLIGMSDLIPGAPLQQLIPMRTLAWIQLVAGVAGRALGRLAFLCARLAVNGESQPEHVHADRTGCGCRLCLQRCCHLFPGSLSTFVSRTWRQRSCLL